MSCTVQSSVWGAITETRLQVRAEGKQSAIAILHYKLTRLPWHVGWSPREFHASSCILSVKRVRIFDEYVGVEQFVRILIGIGFGRFGTPEVNRLLVARNDGVNRRILPRAQTLEAKLSSLVGKGAGDVQGEELRCDLTNHGQVYHRKCWVVPTAGHRFFSPPIRENGVLVTRKISDRRQAARNLQRLVCP